MTTKRTPTSNDTALALAFLKAQQGRVSFLYARVFTFLSAGALVASVLCLAWLVDQATFKDADMAALVPGFLWLGVSYGARVLFSVMADITGARAGVALGAALQRDIVENQWGALQRRTGETLNAAVEGVGALQAYYSQYVPARAMLVALPLGILALTLAVDPLSALIMLVTGPLVVAFMVLIGQGTERRNQRQWSHLARLNGHFLDAIQGMRTLRLLGAGGRERAGIARSTERLRIDTMGVLRIAFLSSLALEFFATVSIALIAVVMGFRLLWGDIAFLHGFLVLLLAPEFYLPLRRMGTHYHLRLEAIAAAGKIAPLVAVAPKAQGTVAWQGGRAPEIVFDNVTYIYEGRDAGVRDVSLRAQAGKTTVLVGPSGAGKTTLLALALGFYASQAGAVRANGADISTFDAASWRGQVSYVPQRPRLMGDTVREAIGMSDRAAGAAQIDALAQALGLDPAQRVAEDGRGLSGGQIQRVAMARALLRQSHLLVMDEPATYLDAESAGLLQDALKAHAGGRTILMSAHRLDTVRMADAIYVMNNGRITAHGTHESLTRDDAFYRACVATMEGGSDA